MQPGTRDFDAAMARCWQVALKYTIRYEKDDFILEEVVPLIENKIVNYRRLANMG